MIQNHQMAPIHVCIWSLWIQMDSQNIENCLIMHMPWKMQIYAKFIKYKLWLHLKIERPKKLLMSTKEKSPNVFLFVSIDKITTISMKF